MPISLLCCMGHNINAASSAKHNPNSKGTGPLGSVLLQKHRSSVATLALSWTQYKSCVFIHRDVVLTTHQNLPDPESAGLAEVAFCVYHHNAKPRSPLKTTITRRLQPTRLFITDASLDLTLVACEPLHDLHSDTVPCLSIPLNGRSVGFLDVGQHVYVVGHLDDSYNRGIATCGYGSIASINGEKKHILQIVTENDLGSLWTPGSAGFDEQGEFCFIVVDPKGLVKKSSESETTDHVVQFGISVRVVKDWILSHGIRDLEDFNHRWSQDYGLINGLSDATLFEININQNLHSSMVLQNEIDALPKMEGSSSRKTSLNSNSSFSSLFEIDISQDMRLLEPVSATQMNAPDLGVDNKCPGSQNSDNTSDTTQETVLDVTLDKGLDLGISDKDSSTCSYMSSTLEDTIPTTDCNSTTLDQQASDSVFWEINLSDDTITLDKKDRVDLNDKSSRDNSINIDIDSTSCLNISGQECNSGRQSSPIDSLDADQLNDLKISEPSVTVFGMEKQIPDSVGSGDEPGMEKQIPDSVGSGDEPGMEKQIHDSIGSGDEPGMEKQIPDSVGLDDEPVTVSDMEKEIFDNIDSSSEPITLLNGIGSAWSHSNSNQTEQDIFTSCSLSMENASTKDILPDIITSHEHCRFQEHSFRLGPIDSTLDEHDFKRTMETITVSNVVDSGAISENPLLDVSAAHGMNATSKTVIDETGFEEISLRTPRLSIDASTDKTDLKQSIDSSANTTDLKQSIDSSVDTTNTQSVDTSINTTDPKQSIGTISIKQSIDSSMDITNTQSIDTSINTTDPKQSIGGSIHTISIKQSIDSSVAGEAKTLQVSKEKSLSPEEVSKRIQGYGNVSMVDIVRRKSGQGKSNEEHTDQSLKNLLLDVRSTFVSGLWTKPSKTTSPDSNP